MRANKLGLRAQGYARHVCRTRTEGAVTREWRSYRLHNSRPCLRHGNHVLILHFALDGDKHDWVVLVAKTDTRTAPRRRCIKTNLTRPEHDAALFTRSREVSPRDPHPCVRGCRQFGQIADHGAVTADAISHRIMSYLTAGGARKHSNP